MADLHGNEPVEFDDATADSLTRALTAAADAVDGQVASRQAYVNTALTDFQGHFSDLFRTNAATAKHDGDTIVSNLRTVAGWVRTMKAAAKEENARRKTARDWYEHQEHRNIFEQGWDAITGGDQPPEVHHEAAPTFPPASVAAGNRQTPSPGAGGGGGGGTSSARPDDLRSFATGSSGLNGQLTGKPASVRNALSEFASKCSWGHIDAGGVVTGFEKWNSANDQDVTWATTVADAFAAAGGNGAVSTVSDAALAASLQAAGVSATRSAIDFEPPTAYGAQPTTGYSVDPVNTTTGNFLEPELDLGFPEASVSLGVTRMYNSLDRHVGVFGPGWASVLETRLLLDDEGAWFVGADGRQVRFPRSGAGWDRGVGEDRWLTREGDDLVVSDADGGRITFTASGLWTSTSPAGPGTAVRVERDADDLVVRLVHDRGRSVDVEHVDGRVTVLRASDGRRVEYGYDDRGRLVAVTDAVGTRRYGWDDDLVVTVTSAAGVVEVDNTYDADRRVVEQVTPHGRRVRFAYLPGRVTAVSDVDGTRSDTYVADAKGRLVAVVDTDGHRQSMAYDAHGNLVSATERDGSVTVHAYDDRGRRVRTVTPRGGDVTTGYDDLDRVTTVVTESGSVVTYEYDGEDRNPSVVVDPAGGRSELTWRDGLLVRSQDPTGVAVDLTYDEHGELVATTNALGQTARIERDAVGRPTAATTPSGARTEYRYDAAGLLTARQDPDGAVWRFEHGPGGRLVATTDPLGARTEMTYAPSGEVATTTDPLGRVVARTFDDLGNVAGLQLPGGDAWTFGHDALSRVRTVTDPTGATWRREYDVNGALTALVDPTGVRQETVEDVAAGVATLRDAFTTTSVRHDEFGRPVSVSAADASAELTVYDACGRPVELVDGEGGLTRLERDLAGRVVAVTTPSGARSTYEYDVCGRPSVATDPTGAQTTLTYDADSRVVARTAPTGEVTTTAYDAVGRVVEQATPGAGTTRFRWDAAGRLVSVADARSGRRRFRYDAAGQLIEVVDGLGGVTRYTYDDRGRVVAVTDPLGGVTRRAYDAADRVVAVTDPLGRTTTAEYDAAGRQTRETDPDGHVTAWTYDAAGLQHELIVDGAVQTTVTRSAVDRSAVVLDESRGAGRAVEHELRWDRRGLLVRRSRGDRAITWEYDADGARIARTDPDGTRTTYARDASGRVVSVSVSDGAPATFTYDRSGRIVQAATGDVVQSWSYEGGALVAHTTGADTTRIDRDTDARITAISRADGRVAYGYDDAGQLVRAGDSTWEYDAAGRLVREVVDGVETTSEYDAAGQLTAVERAGVRTEYRYDGLGRRVRRTEADGRVTEYAWSALGALAEVTSRDAAHTETGRVQLWTDGFGELAAIGDAAVWWDSASAVPSLVSIAGTAVLELPGGVTAVGGATGAAGWRSARATDVADPWAVLGAATGLQAGAGLPAGVTLTASGGVSVAGLEWLGARVYDPSARGFLSVDPLAPVLGAAWSGNPYAYAGNDPLQALDPLGLRPATDQDLQSYRDAHQGAIGAVKNWADDHAYLIAGVAIVAGVALMCTGVGGPAGIAVMALAGGLMSGGISVATQKAEKGTVDWGEVGVQAAIGTVTGAAGAGTGAVMAAKMGTNLAARAATGAVSGAVEGGGAGALNYAVSPGPHTVTGYLQAAGTQAVAGAGAGGLTAYRPKWLSSGTASTFEHGLYRSGYSHGDELLSRAGDTGARKEFGGFWSHDAPTSVAQAREDKAILPEWYDSNGTITGRSPLSSGYTARFGSGTPMYSGRVAPQTGLDGHVYQGGTEQIYIPNSWEHGTIVDQWPIS